MEGYRYKVLLNQYVPKNNATVLKNAVSTMTFIIGEHLPNNNFQVSSELVNELPFLVIYLKDMVALIEFRSISWWNIPFEIVEIS